MPCVFIKARRGAKAEISQVRHRMAAPAPSFASGFMSLPLTLLAGEMGVTVTVNGGRDTEGPVGGTETQRLWPASQFPSGHQGPRPVVWG